MVEEEVYILEHKTDEALMLKVKEDNIIPFNLLVKRYKKYLLNFCYGFISDVQSAEDIAQEVFLRVYKNAKRYQVKAKFKTWLTKIALNLCYDEVKRKKHMKVSSLVYIISGQENVRD